MKRKKGITRRSFVKKTTLASSAIIVTNQALSSCSNILKNDGPFFGNGCRNGWADQNSISIWSRLTEKPSANWKGEKFIKISKEEHKSSLSKLKNPKEIYKRQIPEGLKLKDMQGACLGVKGEVKLEYYPENEKSKIKTINWNPNNPNKDFTIQWKLKNLSSNTKYVINFFARKDIDNPLVTDSFSASFLTPPKNNLEKNISFCIVSCHDFIRRDDFDNGHKIYPSMKKMNPDFYVHTGDIEYYDKPQPWAMTESLMRFKWNRLFALPNQKDFYNNTTSYFMKDDHDTLTNDAYPGMSYGNVSFERGLEIFDFEQFPSNSLPYKTILWGKDLQIWLLDSRNYRSRNSDPDGPEKTIWGKDQKKWVFNTLSKSKATFKVLISANPILGPDRDNKSDNHANDNFKFEKKEILNEIKKYKNLYICNGDRHWQYVTNYENTNFWEFCCGAGTDDHQPDAWEIAKQGIRPEHKFLRTKGGFLSVNIFKDKLGIKNISFKHHGVDGQVVNDQKFQVI